MLVGDSIDYDTSYTQNVPPMIATIVAFKIATYAELHSVYSFKDMWDLYEIAVVDAHNRRVAHKVTELVNKAKDQGA